MVPGFSLTPGEGRRDPVNPGTRLKRTLCLRLYDGVFKVMGDSLFAQADFTLRNLTKFKIQFSGTLLMVCDRFLLCLNVFEG